MSKSQKGRPSMVPGEEQAEKFMALMLWAQKHECDCPACSYFRELAANMLKTHIPGEETSD